MIEQFKGSALPERFLCEGKFPMHLVTGSDSIGYRGVEYVATRYIKITCVADIDAAIRDGHLVLAGVFTLPAADANAREEEQFFDQLLGENEP